MLLTYFTFKFKFPKKFFILIALLFATNAFCQQTVVYPRPESEDDVRSSYPVMLLQQCERKNPRLISLKPSNVSTQQGRSLRQVANNSGIDIAWVLTTKQREEALLPIRIPIDRGLIGWRLLLIKNTKDDVFNTITNNDQLANLLAGQGHDWPDVDILKANDFKVSSSSTYQGLFHMLARERIDYFPRAISEVWPEYEANSHLDLKVHSKLVMYYPSAFYFFVNKNNHFLAKLIEDCLIESIQDGSFKTLFDGYFSDSIKRSNLQNRTILRLTNPLLPAATPINKSEYWFSPEEYISEG